MHKYLTLGNKELVILKDPNSQTKTACRFFKSFKRDMDICAQ